MRAECILQLIHLSRAEHLGVHVYVCVIDTLLDTS
jgi:hypothetical protein